MRKNIPIVSIVILIACAVVGIMQLMDGGELTQKLGMYEGAVREGEYYRIISHAFIHYDFPHFAGNMLCLFFLGQMLESKAGAVNYAIIYLAGILGSAGLIEFAGGSAAMHGGASGAIWGLMGAALVYALRSRSDVRGITRGILFNLILTFTSNVSWQGHIGGLIAGTAISLLTLRPRSDSMGGNYKREEEML